MATQITERDLRELKRKLGQWMFSVMAQISREQYLFLYRQLQDNPKLEKMKEELMKAQEMYTQLSKFCSPKQQQCVGKPFFHGIKFIDGTYINEGGERVVSTRLEFDHDIISCDVRDVSTTVQSNLEFGQYSSTLQEVLQRPLGQVSPIEKETCQKMGLIQEAFQSVKSDFEEQKRKKEERYQEIQQSKEKQLTLKETYQQVQNQKMTDDLQLESSEVDEDDKTELINKRKFTHSEKDVINDAIVSKIEEEYGKGIIIKQSAEERQKIIKQRLRRGDGVRY